MMNSIKSILAGCFLVFSLTAVHSSEAGVAETAMAERINNTVAHLDAARKALAANEADTAQEHLKAAGQTSKNIIGGSFEVKAQRGSRMIANARRLIREGDSAGAETTLQEAEDVFKNLLKPAGSGGRGGLN